MNSLSRNSECWISEKDRIISFHFVKEYIHKKFTNYTDFMKFAILKSKQGFKVQ